MIEYRIEINTGSDEDLLVYRGMNENMAMKVLNFFHDYLQIATYWKEREVEYSTKEFNIIEDYYNCCK